VDAVLALLAGLGIVVALWHLAGVNEGVAIRRDAVGTTPVTVYVPAAAQPAPAIVIAHGFAGSQTLMAPFAVALARAGYTAVTFDFLGHGRNPRPLVGDVTEGGQVTESLVAELAAVAAFARGLPTSDGRLALLGHSMASDIIVRLAQREPAVAATIAVSMYAPSITATSPRNLLVVTGGWETGLRAVAREAVALAAGGPVPEGATVGDIAAGTARRAAVAPGVEHVGVLFAAASQAEARGWLDATFARASDGPLDERGRWLALLLLGVVLLARPLTRLLPVVAAAPQGAGLGWRRLMPAALGPALLTPVILRLAPTDFLPILVGDYLLAHLALYGVLTAAALWLVGAPRPRLAPGIGAGALLVATAATTLYVMLALGLPLDRLFTNLTPIAERAPLILALLAGTLPYFLADEWLTRGAGAPRGAYAITKLCFLVSLALAIALDLRRLFFLIIILPLILGFFVVYGLFSGWAYRRTGHPWVAAGANALALAWAIAVTFPLVES
jgi:dienelactone hydrolase